MYITSPHNTGPNAEFALTTVVAPHHFAHSFGALVRMRVVYTPSIYHLALSSTLVVWYLHLYSLRAEMQTAELRMYDLESRPLLL